MQVVKLYDYGYVYARKVPSGPHNIVAAAKHLP